MQLHAYTWQAQCAHFHLLSSAYHNRDFSSCTMRMHLQLRVLGSRIWLVHKHPARTVVRRTTLSIRVQQIRRDPQLMVKL